jgi:hypothetical protein
LAQPLARDVSTPQQPLLNSVIDCSGPVECPQYKEFVHANIHQNGRSSYQSSEKSLLLVKLPFLRGSCFIYLLNLYCVVHLGGPNARKKTFGGYETTPEPQDGSVSFVESLVRPPTSFACPIAVG